ncbi:MAG: hypothetical protein CME70_16265 [Halobacteriovorax sp.]|nr:hypothetical protein [Halobacteriovorax sp.]|tara:strand:- start:119962 stop:120597 length:636 start_codon:yes stop_codon:yes gene_type:complete
MRVLILGATGLVGSRVLDLMLQDSAVEKVYLVSRRSSGVEHQKIEECIAPLSKMSKFDQAFNVDICFCCLGTTIKKAGSKSAFKEIDYDLPLEAAKLCKLNGVNKFVLISALGADSNSFVFYNKTKGEVEDSISKLGLETFYVVRPSLIVGKREERRPGEALAMIGFKMLDPLFFGPIKKYRGSKVEDIAKLMVSLAKGEDFQTAIEFEKL